MQKFLAAAALVAGAAILVGCSTETTTADVKSIQAEARKDVPKNLEKIPVEKATEGLLNPSAGGTMGTMGGGKKDNTKGGAGR